MALTTPLLSKIISHLALISTLAITTSLSGCDGSTLKNEVVTENTSAISWDLSQEDELLAYTKVQIKTYNIEGYTEITNGNTPSGVSSDPMRVWINNDQADAYKNLGTHSAFPIGTTIIRALCDQEGEAKKITVTVKAGEGANPASNDWVFAVANPNGVLAASTTNKWEFGSLSSCNGCHTTKLDTAGLFGLGAK